MQSPLKEQLNQQREDKEKLKDALSQKERELDKNKKQMIDLTFERDSFKRQINDLRNTVEYQEAKMESGGKECKINSRAPERRSLRRKRTDKSSKGQTLQSPLDSEAMHLISQYAKANAEVISIDIVFH